MHLTLQLMYITLKKRMKKMNRKLAFMDIIFYMVIPYFIWNYGQSYLGDYFAMLLSTVPGFFYTIFRFWKEKQFNIGGLFIIGTLFIGTTVNLLSGSAESMIWNGIYLGLFYVFIHAVALLLQRPLALYFAVDFVYLQGQPRKQSTELFYKKGIFGRFQLIQFVFIIRGLSMAGLNIWLLKKYGVDGYGNMIIYRQVAGWTFSLLIMGLFFYTSVPINNYLKKQGYST